MKTSKLIAYIIENNLENDFFEGKILWFSKRDGHGIILMKNGSEIYTDISTYKNEIPEPGNTVSFNFNTKIKDCACASNCKITNKKAA